MPFEAGPHYKAKSEVFRALAHPARLRIIELLRDGERSVGSLKDALGVDSASASQHLAALRRAGIVEGRRDAPSVYYRVTDDEIFALLEATRRILGRRLEVRRDLLDRLAAE